MAHGHALGSHDVTSRPGVASEKAHPSAPGEGHSKTRGPVNHPGIGVRLQPSPGQFKHTKPKSRQSHTQSHARTARAQVSPKSPVQAHTVHKNARKTHAHPSLTANKSQARGSNRLGQRARRALSEKLYGKAAKHVNSEGTGRQRADANAARDFQSSLSLAGPQVHQGGDGCLQAQRVPAVNVSAQKHKRDPVGAVGHADSKPLVPLRGVVDESHPSWVAKRQQNALLRLRPCGRKTVFQDKDAAEVFSASPALRAPAAPRLVGEHGTEHISESHARSASAAGMLGSERKRGRERSWGDAGRETVSSFVPDCPRIGPCGSTEQCSSVGLVMKPDNNDARHDHADGNPKGLHPSWVAAKRRKLELAKLQAISIASPIGKKITFDD